MRQKTLGHPSAFSCWLFPLLLNLLSPLTVSSSSPVQNVCVDSTTGAVGGLCQAGFVLGCNNSCVWSGAEHRDLRCRILNRKFKAHESSADPPWLAECKCSLQFVGQVVNTSVLNWPQGVAVSPDGRYAYVTASESSSVVVLDVGTTPGAATVVGFWQDPSRTIQPYAVAVSPDGDTIYVTNYQTGDVVGSLLWFDVSDPEKPSLQHSLSTYLLRGAVSVSLSGNGQYAYVVATAYYSLLVKIHCAARVAVATYYPSTDTFRYLTDVSVSTDGTVAFLVGYGWDFSGVLQLLDIATTTTTPRKIADLAFGSSIALSQGVTTSPDGQFVYVVGGGLSDEFASMVIVNVTVPSSPLVVSYLLSTSRGQGWLSPVASSNGSLVYCTTGSNVIVVNVENVSSPYIAFETDSSRATAVALAPDASFAYSVAGKEAASFNIVGQVCPER